MDEPFSALDVLTADGNLRAGFFLDLLRRGFGPDDAQRQLDIAIDWGRYAEPFDYDTDSDQISAAAATVLSAAGPGASPWRTGADSPSR